LVCFCYASEEIDPHMRTHGTRGYLHYLRSRGPMPLKRFSHVRFADGLNPHVCPEITVEGMRLLA